MTSQTPSVTDALERLAALEAAATPGPWDYDGDGYAATLMAADGSQLIEEGALLDADAALIAASRNALPALIAAARAAVTTEDWPDSIAILAVREALRALETEL